MTFKNRRFGTNPRMRTNRGLQEICIVLVMSLMAGLSVIAYSKPSIEQKTDAIKKMYIMPKACNYKVAISDGFNGVVSYEDCPRKSRHGDIHIVYTNGQNVKITNSGVAYKKYAISPDRRTAAWLDGRHFLNDNKTLKIFGPTRLVLYSNGKVLRIFSADKESLRGAFIWDFHFWNNGKQVALMNGAKRGPSFFYLYNISNGRLIAKFDEAVAMKTGEKMPNWVKRFTN